MEKGPATTTSTEGSEFEQLRQTVKTALTWEESNTVPNGRQQEKIIRAFESGDIDVLTQPSVPDLSAAERTSFFDKLKTGKIDDAQIKDFIERIQLPSSNQERKTEILAKLGDRQWIPNSLYLHGFFENKEKWLEDFMQEYPTPESFEKTFVDPDKQRLQTDLLNLEFGELPSGEKSHTEDNIRDKAHDLVQNYPQLMAMLYGKRKEYWDQIKLLKREAKHEVPQSIESQQQGEPMEVPIRQSPEQQLNQIDRLRSELDRLEQRVRVGEIIDVNDHFQVAVANSRPDLTPNEARQKLRELAAAFKKDPVSLAGNKEDMLDRGKLKEVKERLFTREVKASSPEKEPGFFKRATEYLSKRSADLGTKFVGFGKGVVKDVFSLGHFLRNPIESYFSVRSKIERVNGIERAKAYGKYLLDRDKSLSEKGTHLYKGFYALGEGYRKLPLRFKLYLSAAMLGGSVLTGGTSALVTTIFASAKVTSRVLSGAGIYTLVEGMGESRLQNKEALGTTERTKLDSFKKHGIASAAAILVASGVPGAAIRDLFLGGEEGIAYLHTALHGSTPLHTGVSGGPISPPSNPSYQTEGKSGGNVEKHASLGNTENLPKTNSLHTANNTPQKHPTAPHTKTPEKSSTPKIEKPTIPEQHAPKLPEMPKIPASKAGAEGMIKELWKQLHDPSKHFTLPPNTDPNSDLARLWNADAKSIGSVSHQISSDRHHEWFSNGKSIVIKPGEQMTIVNGELRIVNTHGEVIKPAYQAQFSSLRASVSEPGDNTADQLNFDELKSLHSHNSAYAKWQTEQFSQPSIKPAIHTTAQSSMQISESSNTPSNPLEYTQPFINTLGVPIDPTHIHVFQDNEGKIIVYGNDYELRSNIALAYAQSHPDTVIWVQSDIPANPDSTWRPSVFGVRYDSASATTESRTVATGLINPNTFTKQLN